MYDDEQIIRRVHFDYVLLIVTVILVMIGIIMVYSSSATLAHERVGDEYYYLKKEIIFAVIGFVLLIAATKIPYHWWKKLVYPVLGCALLALVLSFIPGIK